MILRSKEITRGAGEILGERINRGARYGFEILGICHHPGFILGPTVNAHAIPNTSKCMFD